MSDDRYWWGIWPHGKMELPGPIACSGEWTRSLGIAELECGRFDYQSITILHWVYSEIAHNDMVKSMFGSTSVDSTRKAWETSLVKIVKDTSWM